MISKQDITHLFSKAYLKASLMEDSDMYVVTDLLESVRTQMALSEPYNFWDTVAIDNSRFNYDYCLEVLNELQESFFNLLFQKQLDQINEALESKKSEALRLWMLFFADAAVHFRDDMVCILCHHRLKWDKKNKSLEKLSKLPKLMREGYWIDAYPYYLDIAANTELSNEIRALAELTVFQIILYHFPEHSNAKLHLQNASSLLPKHFWIERANAEFLLKTGETQKARDRFLSVIAMKPGDYYSFNYIGDCYLIENKLDNAASWYFDAIQLNFFQSESYKRLLNLYCNKTWITEKEPEIENMLGEIKKRLKFNNITPLTDKRATMGTCYKDLQLYQSFRDVGAGWYNYQNFEKSEEWYTKAVNLEPEIADAIIDLAYLKLNQENTDSARELFYEALKVDKQNFEVFWGLAYFYQMQNNEAETIKYYKKSLSLRPHWKDVVNNAIGNYYFNHKNYNASVPYYTKSVEANQSHPVYTKNLAGAYQAQAKQYAAEADDKKAEKLYLKSVNIEGSSKNWNDLGVFYYNLNRINEALSCYIKAIEIENSQSVYYSNLALAYEKLEQFTEAEIAYKQALDLDPDSGAKLNTLGVFYYDRQNYDKSIEYYVKAIEKDTQNPVYYENIALSYTKKQLYSEAITNYEKAIALSPDNPRAFNYIGLIYYQQQNYTLAILNYKKAIELDDNNWVYHSNLALALDLSGESEEAIEAYQKSLSLNKNDYLNWNALGIIYYNLGEMDKAIECYSNSIAYWPEDPVLFENLALAYEKKEMITEAVENYKKAVVLKPDNPRVLNIIGLLLYNQKFFEEAIIYYRKALALDNNNWIYVSNLALALRFSGNLDEAIVNYKIAINLNDDNFFNWNELGNAYYFKEEYQQAIECYHKAILRKSSELQIYINLALALNRIDKLNELNAFVKTLDLSPEFREQLHTRLNAVFPMMFDKA